MLHHAGLAFFYGGMVHKGSILYTMFQSISTSGPPPPAAACHHPHTTDPPLGKGPPAYKGLELGCRLLLPPSLVHHHLGVTRMCVGGVDWW